MRSSRGTRASRRSSAVQRLCSERICAQNAVNGLFSHSSAGRRRAPLSRATWAALQTGERRTASGFASCSPSLLCSNLRGACRNDNSPSALLVWSGSGHTLQRRGRKSSAAQEKRERLSGSHHAVAIRTRL